MTDHTAIALSSVADTAACRELTVAECPNLLEYLSRVPDPRGRQGRRHGLGYLLGVAVAAVAAGSKMIVDIAAWAKAASQDVLAALGARAGRDGVYRAPSESLLGRFMQIVDAQALDDAAGQWARDRLRQQDADLRDAELRDAVPAGTAAPLQRPGVAVDGKVVRSAREHSDPSSRAPCLVAAFDHDHGVVLAQRQVDSKSNEITATEPLLSTVDITGSVITVDALHTQRDFANVVVRQGGDYLFVVKENQPTLLEQVIAATTGPDSAFTDNTHVSTDAGHGRTEKRTLRVAPATGVDFPHAAQAIRIRRDRGGPDGQRTSKEIVYAITSLTATEAGPSELAGYARAHWGIENKLHYVRDTAYREDESRVRTGNAPRVMATFRNIAISAIRLTSNDHRIARTLRRNRYDFHATLSMLGINTTSRPPTSSHNPHPQRA